MATYVVATKREARSEGVTVEERIRSVPGVDVRGSRNADRVLIEASPQTASQILERFGDKLVVEPEIRFDLLGRS